MSLLPSVVLHVRVIQARRECADIGGLLAVLNTPASWDEVASILFRKRPLGVYIGLASASSNLPQM